MSPQNARSSNGRHSIKTERLAPQTGTAFRLTKGDRLRVTDPEGGQVADLVCFADTEDPSEAGVEWLSSGRTFDYNETLLLTSGHMLYSNRSRPMLMIEEDTCGRHDFLLTPCSPDTFRLLYENAPPDHPSCFVNLHTHLARFGIKSDQIPTTFNIFMNVRFGQDGRISVDPPTSVAGDHIIFRAELDLIVGLTACSAEQSNNGKFSPVDYAVLPVALQEDT